MFDEPYITAKSYLHSDIKITGLLTEIYLSVRGFAELANII